MRYCFHRPWSMILLAGPLLTTDISTRTGKQTEQKSKPANRRRSAPTSKIFASRQALAGSQRATREQEAAQVPSQQPPRFVTLLCLAHAVNAHPALAVQLTVMPRSKLPFIDARQTLTRPPSAGKGSNRGCQAMSAAQARPGLKKPIAHRHEHAGGSIAKGAAIEPERQIRARRRQMALSSIMVPLPSPNSRRVAVCELDSRIRKGSLDLG